ncbi:hypothetical protein BT63DRAFT_308838 [Microthyrium microscopicum]|uniref:C2H2-type domain-containing protein n=1 Tax=Microthyrium microscopicum TaxID=703497 RepID=A0A6A6UAC2_9PEZI|nr:hypothetical protein BT63DRAFT_308838 [Microthyrium microscopicum]
MSSPPESPLSDISSEELPEDIPQSARSISISPFPESRPVKRQRVSAGGSNAHRRQSAMQSHPTAFADHADDASVMVAGVPSDVDISSDTEGSVPGSIHNLHLGTLDEDDDKAAAGGKEQISHCRWEGCEAGDQGNMDLLVKHLHDEHIHARQKKYSCEWIDCPRKGIAHASGYALRAHMRSHTREKPFYCTLPECDRSFTRSDALAKHMRTVHETEALRPSDPVPKHHSSNPQNKSQRLRLTFNKWSAGSNNGKDDDAMTASSKQKESPLSPTIPTIEDIDYEKNNATFTRDPATGEWIPHFPDDISFSEKDLALGPAKLYQKLKYQYQWACEEQDELTQQIEAAEKVRKAEWMAKELVLQDVIDIEKAIVPDDDDMTITKTEEDMDIDADLDEEREMSMDPDEDDDQTHLDDSVVGLPPLPYGSPAQTWSAPVAQEG